MTGIHAMLTVVDILIGGMWFWLLREVLLFWKVCKRAETVGLEAVLVGIVVDDLILKPSQEGAELGLYIMELKLPPCPRMRAIVSERRGLELSASFHKFRGDCPDPDTEKDVKRCHV